MSNGYRLVLHTDRIIERFSEKYAKAQKFLDMAVLKDSATYVPMRTGNLMISGNTGTIPGSGRVEYNAPYAIPMYYGVGFHFSKDKHPQACAQWFETAKATKKDAWIKGVNKIMKE